jgi:carbon-monoxide dehydrogenase catalytic subunit
LKSEERTIDPAARAALDKAEKEDIKTIWDRYQAMAPHCGFGELGICCSNCLMGPCRIDPFSEEEVCGACGADVHTIVARNLARAIAAGVAAHADHAREMVLILKAMSEGEAGDFVISSPGKLKALAEELGIKAEGLETMALAGQVADTLIEQFGRQHGPLYFLNRAPKGQHRRWESMDVAPRGIDRDIVEILHRTHEGVDSDYRNIVASGVRAALADGWGGSMIATELSDILFGRPVPVRSEVNLGVLREDEVNVVVHGHEPALSEMLVRAAREPDILDLAKSKGASGINLTGICCTANEVLMRQGLPIAGNFLQQELAIVTGAVELMVVDVQCIIPGLTHAARCFHTKLVTTSDKAKMAGVEHVGFEEARALELARKILTLAVDNYPKRIKEQVEIPKEKVGLVAGFTSDNVFHHLGGSFRGSYRPLNDAIMSGRIRGVAGVIGCTNPRIKHDYNHITMVKELIKNDVLVVQTGCSAIACAKIGLLQPEAALEKAGKGLREVCEAVGIPPVLHFGSCVDNSRILLACAEMVREGGIGADISELPVAGAAPEAMSEKAVAIGFYAVGSGIFTVFSPQPAVIGSNKVTELICKELKDHLGGGFEFEPDPLKGARLIIDHLNQKRKELSLKPMMYE